MRARTLFAGAAVAVGLLAGSTGAATAQEPESPPNRPPRAICEHLDEIEARIDKAEARYAQIHQRLVDARARATDAGRDDLVARLDQALARLEEHHARRSARAAERLERLVAFCAEAPGEGDAEA